MTDNDKGATKYRGIWRPELFLFTALVYGFANTVPKSLFSLDFSPLLWLACITTLGALTLLIFLRGQVLKTTKTDVKWGLLVGALNSINLIGLVYGLKIAGPAATVLIYSAGILFIPFINFFITKEKPRLIHLLSIIIVACGLVFALAKFGTPLSFGWGEFIVLLTAFVSAILFVTLTKASRKTQPMNLNFITLCTCALITAAAYFIFDFPSEFSGEMLNHIWVIVFVGVVSQGVTFLLQTKGQAKVDANVSSIYAYTSALFGVGFSILLGFEDFRWNLIVGSLIVFVGLMLSPLITKIKERKTKAIKESGRQQRDGEK